MGRKFVVLILGWAALAALAACQGPPTPTVMSPNNAVVHIAMDEWRLKPSVISAPPGWVTLEAVNTGDNDHEVVILKTDKAADSLVVGTDAATGDTKVNEEASGDNLGEVEVESGTTHAGTFKLTPGKYVLICNVPKHYKSGMYAAFEVR